MTTSKESIARGRRRRAVLMTLVEQGYGDLSALSIIYDDNRELWPACKNPETLIKRELLKIRRSLGEPKSAGECSLLTSLRKQLVAIEASNNPALAAQGAKIANEIATITSNLIVRPGVAKHLASRPRHRRGVIDNADAYTPNIAEQTLARVISMPSYGPGLRGATAAEYYAQGDLFGVELTDAEIQNPDLILAHTVSDPDNKRLDKRRAFIAKYPHYLAACKALQFYDPDDGEPLRDNPRIAAPAR